jgi:hypothetical protein
MPLGEIHELQDPQDGYTWTEYECSRCGERYESEDEAVDCCVFTCEQCGAEYHYEDEALECCSYFCPNCGERWDTEEAAEECCMDEAPTRDPWYPRDLVSDLEIAQAVFIPEIEGRPARLCSIEQELASGGAAVASMLYDQGWSRRSEMVNYSNDGDQGRAVVKEDGSLPYEGGEVVYSRFMLNYPDQARDLSNMLAAINALERQGVVRTDVCAGTHIHVSAVDEHGKVFGPAQMAALYEMETFAEDVIFRIGAAGWPSHRGSHYTRLMPKLNVPEDRPDPRWGISPGKIAKLSRRERYYSLNFQRLLTAVQSCGCGACMVGDWNECDCGVLDRGTIEWRIFNSTTDPKHMHAWLLLAQGMTAKAFNHQLGTLEPHEFERTDPELHPWILGWLLWELPLLNEERQVILDVARQAPGLEVPWNDLDQAHEHWGNVNLPQQQEPEPEPAPEDILVVPANGWVGADGDYNSEFDYVIGCTCQSCMANMAHEQEVLAGRVEQPVL